MRRALALASAVGLDAAFGDPPNAAHPVAWFGSFARTVESAWPSRWRDRRGGIAAAVGLATAAAIAGVATERAWPRWAGGRAVASGGLLALAISRRTLATRALEVADALDAGDIEEARRLLAWHLVSRDTSTLGTHEVAGAVIESVAENLSDGVLAPCWWFVLGGVLAAWGYRALNTLDGMWGYRTARYEAFGFGAARGDDLANLVPARLTAAAIVVAAGLDGRGIEASRAWWADHGATSSPNAGHPMSAMAGALGVSLGKRGEYVLHPAGRAPDTEDIRRAVRLADRAGWIALGGLGLWAAAR